MSDPPPDVPVQLPSYLPRESFLRLSQPAREMVVRLLTNPPEPPKGYLKRKELFAAHGYQSYVHYEIARLLEHLEYDSD
jgi:hypothetical protein